MANPNPKVTHTGGRSKAGDIFRLLQLWDGQIKIEDIKFKERVIKVKEFISVPVHKEVLDKRTKKKRTITEYVDKLVTKEKIERSFASGFDSLAYDVLIGDKPSRHKVMDKLYADQRNVSVEDNSTPTRDKLKDLSNAELAKLEKELKEQREGR